MMDVGCVRQGKMSGSMVVEFVLMGQHNTVSRVLLVCERHSTALCKDVAESCTVLFCQRANDTVASHMADVHVARV